MMKKIVLALGYFDSLHIGHQEILKRVKGLAEELFVEPAVFTFDGDLNAYFGKKPLQVFTKTEKELKLADLGITEIIYAPVSEEFLSKSKEEFLEFLDGRAEVVAYVCGSDFCFGNKAEGNVEFLKEYAENRGRKVIVVDEVLYNGNRASTTLVKNSLAIGDIKTANGLLGYDFSVTGTVVKGRGDGKKMDFPTVNVEVSKEKFMPKFAVYTGYVIIDGKRYKSVINYGFAPTFGIEKSVLEAFIIGFDGDLYGKTLTVYFTDYIREICKFSSIEELKDRIKKDIAFYD